MILPICIYGDPRLRSQCKEVHPDYPSLDILITNMFDTMYNANGLGLAAPQIGLNFKLFIVDTYYFDLDRNRKKYKQVFINAKIKIYKVKKDLFLEGCLSFPGILDQIERNSIIKLEYYDEKWNKQSMYLTGILSRIIQHEYDHIHGKLFIDYLPIRILFYFFSKLKLITTLHRNYPKKKNA
jgi:peptide deformylase